MNHHPTHFHVRMLHRSVAHILLGIVAILAIIAMLLLFRSAEKTAKFAYDPQSSLYQKVGSEEYYPNIRVLPAPEELPVRGFLFCRNDADCPGSAVCRNRYVLQPGFNEIEQPAYAKVCVAEE